MTGAMPGVDVGRVEARGSSPDGPDNYREECECDGDPYLVGEESAGGDLYLSG